MIPEKRKPAKIGIGVGIILILAPAVLYTEFHPTLALRYMSLAFDLIGMIFFTWGCMNYVAGKGYSKWFGLAGLMSAGGLLYGLVGLFFCLCFRDLHTKSK